MPFATLSPFLTPRPNPLSSSKSSLGPRPSRSDFFHRTFLSPRFIFPLFTPHALPCLCSLPALFCQLPHPPRSLFFFVFIRDPSFPIPLSPIVAALSTVTPFRFCSLATIGINLHPFAAAMEIAWKSCMQLVYAAARYSMELRGMKEILMSCVSATTVRRVFKKSI